MSDDYLAGLDTTDDWEESVDGRNYNPQLDQAFHEERMFLSSIDPYKFRLIIVILCIFFLCLSWFALVCREYILATSLFLLAAVQWIDVIIGRPQVADEICELCSFCKLFIYFSYILVDFIFPVLWGSEPVNLWDWLSDLFFSCISFRGRSSDSPYPITKLYSPVLLSPILI